MKNLIAAIVGLGVIANGAAANATPQFKRLLTTLQQAGVTLIADEHPSCKNPRNLGRYEFNGYTGQNDFIVCLENHHNNEEVRNTVLHEAVHVVQACRGGQPLYTYGSLVRASDPEQIAFIGRNYPEDQVHQELEARVIADNEDEVSINNLVQKYCF